MIAVFDASVLVKLFVAEEWTAEAIDAAAAAEVLHVPDVVRLDVAAAIARGHRFPPDEARQKVAKWTTFLGLSNVQVTPFPDLLPDALELSLHVRLPLPDCVYLALARRRQVPLVTADRTLADAALVKKYDVRHLSAWATRSRPGARRQRG